MTNTTYERIDIERCGARSLTVRKWEAGYNVEDAGAPQVEEFIQDGSLDAELKKLEDQGYTVWIARSGMGHALKGQITRVDFIFTGDAWIMSKFPRGWKAQTRPIETKHFGKDQTDSAVKWLRENNWTIVEWDGSYRAFKGKAQPVHDAETIRSLRRKHPNTKLNLAYYF